MNKYIYKVMNSEGFFEEGELWAEHLAEAKMRLTNQGYVVVNIKENRKKKSLRRQNPWKKRVIIYFAFQMGILLEAGLTIRHICSILAMQKKRDLPIQEISESIERGMPIWKALEVTGLPCFAVTLIRAGEESGRLGQAFLYVHTLYEQDKQQRDKILQIMAYPAFVFVLMIMFFFGSILFILPSFKEVFASMQVAMPKGMLILLALGTWFKSHGLLVMAIIVLGMLLLFKLGRNKFVRYHVDAFLWRHDRIFYLLKAYTYSQVFHVKAMLLESGLTLTYTIQITKSLWTNRYSQEQIEKLLIKLEEGYTCKEAYEQANLGLPVVYELIGAGEASGELEQMMRQCAMYYHKEVMVLIGRLERVMEPLLMSLMGILVGSLVMSIMIPLFESMQSIGTK